MRARMISAVIFAIAGLALLLALGNWQVRRLHWKLGVLEQIETRIAADPVALPANPDRDADRYLAVTSAGRFAGDPVRVQSALEGQGAGYRLVQRFETGEGAVLVERGFVRQGDAIPPAPGTAPGDATPEISITGNLVWPEVDSFTPDPEPDLWYARDVDAIAESLGTRPVLIVLRGAQGRGQGVIPTPVGTAGIPNDHKGYAITWYALAVVWLAMSAALIYRMFKQSKGRQS